MFPGKLLFPTTTLTVVPIRGQSGRDERVQMGSIEQLSIVITRHGNIGRMKRVLGIQWTTLTPIRILSTSPLAIQSKAAVDLLIGAGSDSQLAWR